jgi:type I restriction enzyme M protein
MSNPAPQFVQKLWNYCNILRDDGLSYGDYVEQLTFLLFLKMADEQSRPPFNPPSRPGFGGTGKPSPVPPQFSWPELLKRDGDELEIHYRHTLEELGKRSGMNLDIFWLKDDALEESANLPAPEIIAADITADLEAALEQFATIAEDLKR